MDEDILQSGLDLMPFVLVGTERRDGLLKGSGVPSAHVQHVAECHRLLHAGTCAQLFGQLSQILTAHGPSREALVSDHFIYRTVSQQFAVSNVGEPMAALRLIHVMSRN